MNSLRSFEAAARHLGFGTAAQELGVTASAISVQVRRLEAQIGRSLFERDHRTLRLTRTGQRLASRLSSVFLELDRVLADELGQAINSLQISTMPSFASKWLASRLPDFGRRPGSPSVRLTEDDRLLDLKRGEADACVRYGPGEYDGLRCELLAPAKAFPVCSPRFLAENAEALSHPIGYLGLPLLVDETSLNQPSLPDWASWFGAVGIQATRVTRRPVFAGLHMALAAAAAGHGLALGLSPLVNDDLRAGTLVRLHDAAVESPYGFWFVCRSERARDRKIRAFRNWIFDQMEKDR